MGPSSCNQITHKRVKTALKQKSREYLSLFDVHQDNYTVAADAAVLFAVLCTTPALVVEGWR